jgi:hypothetical protein
MCTEGQTAKGQTARTRVKQFSIAMTKGKPGKKTSNGAKLLFTLAIVFVVSFCAGYLKGVSARKQPEFLFPRVAAGVRLEVDQPQYYLSGIQPKYYLIYEGICFDVESKTLSMDTTNAVSFALHDYDHDSYLSSQQAETFAAAMLGGGATWTIKDFFSAVEKQRSMPNQIRDVIFMVLACLSGYELGFWVSTSDAKIEDSKDLREFLKNTGVWLQLENFLWLKLYSGTYLARAGRDERFSMPLTISILDSDHRTDPYSMYRTIDQKELLQLVKEKASSLNASTQRYNTGDGKTCKDFQNVRELGMLTIGGGFREGFFEFWRATPEERAAAQRAFRNRQDFRYHTGFSTRFDRD